MQTMYNLNPYYGIDGARIQRDLVTSDKWTYQTVRLIVAWLYVHQKTVVSELINFPSSNLGISMQYADQHGLLALGLKSVHIRTWKLDDRASKPEGTNV